LGTVKKVGVGDDGGGGVECVWVGG